MLISALLLTGVMAWALWDEVYLMRPWKNYQVSFVKRYERYLKRLERRGFQTEQQVKESPEYQQLDARVREARAAVQPQIEQINGEIKAIDAKLNAITEEFQDRRGRITVANYEIEVADADDKEDLRREVDKLKSRKVSLRIPADGANGETVKRELDYNEIEAMYNTLKERRGELLSRNSELLKDASELERKRDEYLKDNVTGVTEQQVRLLRAKLDNYDYGLKQISIDSGEMVERCETCHLGIREPIRINASDMMSTQRSRRTDMLARAFVSHPSKELLDIHNPEKFGCSSCHWGNGRASTTMEKGHGRHRFWLHPLFARENMEAGCNQCHAGDRVLQGAPTLNLGKDLFYERGCVGCHRYEGFDRESDALTNTRQLVKQLQDQRSNNEREARQANEDADNAPSDEQALDYRKRAESLVVTNSQIEARIAELDTQTRHLLQDQKKIGPNLKDVRLKLRKEWIPEWLRDPQGFRPGTKMPTFWYLTGEEHSVVPVAYQNEERMAISAYLWQSAYEGRMPSQARGDARRGEEMFKTIGCMGCHSIGEGEGKVGGDFAANLTRVGQKASYDYIVKWVYNPRERWAPYCPKEKRDLTPEDYKKHGKSFTFDTARNSRCPNDGAELQVQNMTVMPNFRLTEQEARDIATYLVTLAPPGNYPAAAYMDDARLAEKGKNLIKQYGCAGCHEIRGFEDEQRIGKELTAEGATPLERLDFALLTHKAELGINPYTGERMVDPKTKKTKSWYNHKGFFEHKITDPALYDKGKEKDPREHLRMPKPYLTDEWKTALTTFLLGSVGTEGMNVPLSLFYKPTDRQKAIQDGWWVIKKYNCMGCHTVQVGQRSTLSTLPWYEQGGDQGTEQLPPGLTTEGARVDPDWLLLFLNDPSLSGWSEGLNLGGPAAPPGNGGGQRAQGRPEAAERNGHEQLMGALKQQPGESRNGVRTYLRVRMPTFNFSPNELGMLVRFFMAVSAQQEPNIREEIEPLTEQERNLARSLFTMPGSSACFKCHITGNPATDVGGSAPNFLQAGTRLKPDWTYRWLIDPQRIMPGTAMPAGLFAREGDRWIFNGPQPPEAAAYQGDHARLLVRYILQLTPDEQARISRSQPASAPPAATAPQTPTAVAKRANSRKGSQRSASMNGRSRQSANAKSSRARAGRQTSGRSPASAAPSRSGWRQSASSAAGFRRFSP